MMRIDPGAIGFTSGFSQEHRYSTVGEQITVEQLTKLSIVMRISRHDHVYRHHVRDKQIETILHLLLLLHSSTAIQHASVPKQSTFSLTSVPLLVLSCKQQTIALSKVHNVNNTFILRQSIAVLPLVATTHLQPQNLLSLSQIKQRLNPTIMHKYPLLESQVFTWPRLQQVTESMQDHK